MEEKDKRLILLLLSSSLSLLREHANDVRRGTRAFRPGEARRCERILFLHFNFAYAFHRRSQLFTGLKRLFPCDLFVLLSVVRMKKRLPTTKKIRYFTISRESFRVLLIKVVFALFTDVYSSLETHLIPSAAAVNDSITNLIFTQVKQ